MNYRHAFHAGNHADVLKHAVLLAILARLREKSAAFAALDTHAGAGLYDLTAEEAARSPEWRDGVGRLMDWAEAPPLVAALADAVRRANATPALEAYPGSPWLIREALRANDRLIACELRAEEAERLRRTLDRDARVHVHVRDAWEAVRAFTPFAEKRGLVLIDPPYEDRARDLARGVEAVTTLAQRFSGAIVAWWRPLKDPRELDACDGELESRIALKAVRADLAVAAPDPAGRMTASSMLVVNPPFGLADRLAADLAPLAVRLATGAGAFGRMRVIGRL